MCLFVVFVFIIIHCLEKWHHTLLALWGGQGNSSLPGSDQNPGMTACLLLLVLLLQVASSVIELQAMLPNARVLYCSATGVSEVSCSSSSSRVLAESTLPLTRFQHCPKARMRTHHRHTLQPCSRCCHIPPPLCRVPPTPHPTPPRPALPCRLATWRTWPAWVCGVPPVPSLTLSHSWTA